MPEREHMPDGPETEGAPHREGYRFFEEGISEEDAWDLFETAIRVGEKEEGPFNKSTISTLLHGIDHDLKNRRDDGALQLAMKEMLTTRLLYKNIGVALDKGVAEEYSNIITDALSSKDNKLILGLVGMEMALSVLDDETYWRTDKKILDITPTQRVMVARGIEGDAQEMAHYRRKFSGIDLSSFTDEQLTAIFESKDLLTKKEADLTDAERATIGALGLDASRKNVALRVIDQVDRDLTLAKTAYNLTGKSAELDGVVLKGGAYAKIDKASLRYIDGTGTEREINLADPRTYTTTDLDWLRKNKGFLIGKAWDKAWREFFKNNWESIDFDKSLEGKASGLIKRRFYNPIRYEKREEKNPGEAAYLRRYTYVGVLPMTLVGMRNVKEMLEEWDLGVRLDVGGRLKNGDKVRKMFTEEAPGLLNDPNVINAPDLQGLASIIKAMGYLPHEEQMEMGAHWLEGLVTYRLRYNNKDFNYENIDSRQAEVMLRTAWGLHLIDEEAERIISHKILGNPIIVYMVTSLQAGEPAEAVLDMVKAFFKAVVGSK